MNFSCYRAVKLLEHGMKVVERVFKKRFHRIVTVNKMLFGIMSEKGTIDTMFILGRQEKEYYAIGKNGVCIFRSGENF